jgi:acyl-CoA thioesterase FadM
VGRHYQSGSKSRRDLSLSFTYDLSMFSSVFSVSPADLDTWGHPEVGHEVDGAVIGTHLTYDKVLRFCGFAWVEFFESLGTGLFVPHIAMTRIECDYHAEVTLGEIRCDTSVIRVGRSSMKLQIDVSQQGTINATTIATLISFDHVQSRSVTLTSTQRGALAPHVVPASAAI